MKALYETATKKIERVFLVGAEFKSRSAGEVRDSIDELALLTATAGGQVVGSLSQRLQTPRAGTFIGRGKADEIGALCDQEAIDTVIFDDELSPAQSRNLERILECKVVDRTTLILDIFAQRARTREGKLQVELAQLQHLLPRLTRFWTHLSRQKGGIGMRGEGETQLETDRRRVQERITSLMDELNLVRRQRATQRSGRRRHLWPVASIVGYTNAGKSTLLNAVTGAGVLAEDRLFATLDPTTRRLTLPTNQSVLLSDTVGFIRKLPHQLVEAFRATLEEVVTSDLLLHVVDSSHPNPQAQIQAVHAVLDEIGAAGKPTLTVFNKVDQLSGHAGVNRLAEQHVPAVAVSAATGEGFPALLAELGALLRPIRDFIELEIPHSASGTIARLHAVGQVVERHYIGSVVRLRARIPPHLRAEFDPYIQRDLGPAGQGSIPPR